MCSGPGSYFGSYASVVCWSLLLGSYLLHWARWPGLLDSISLFFFFKVSSSLARAGLSCKVDLYQLTFNSWLWLRDSVALDPKNGDDTDAFNQGGNLDWTLPCPVGLSLNNSECASPNLLLVFNCQKCLVLHCKLVLLNVGYFYIENVWLFHHSHELPCITLCQALITVFWWWKPWSLSAGWKDRISGLGFWRGPGAYCELSPSWKDRIRSWKSRDEGQRTSLKHLLH